MKPENKEWARRRKILEAATRVFERSGLAKASMRTIALEAGCTTGAIYPLFSGKEDIYASLLEDSLDRLHVAVAKRAAREAEAISALIAAANGFYDYYANKRFELDLGLYLFGTENPKSLGRNRDRVLNARLLQTLDIFKTCFIRLAPEGVSRQTATDWAQQERDVLFATLLGVLMLAHTGRATSVGTDAGTILQTSLKTMKERLIK